MAVIVNIAQYNSVPDVQSPPGTSTGAVAQMAGPLIEAENVSVDGSATVAWSTTARFAVATVITSGGLVYARSAATDSPPLAVGEGQAIKDNQPIVREGSHAHLLLREHA